MPGGNLARPEYEKKATPYHMALILLVLVLLLSVGALPAQTIQREEGIVIDGSTSRKVRRRSFQEYLRS